MKPKAGISVIPNSPTSLLGRKGFIVNLQGKKFPWRETLAPNPVLENSFVLFGTFFQVEGESVVFQSVLETLFRSLLSDDLPSLPWGRGPSRGKPEERRAALAPTFMKLSLVCPSPPLCQIGGIEQRIKGSFTLVLQSMFLRG